MSKEHERIGGLGQHPDWIDHAAKQSVVVSKPNVYEREIQHWKSLVEMLMRERELKKEPVYICAVCAEKIGLDGES